MIFLSKINLPYEMLNQCHFGKDLDCSHKQITHNKKLTPMTLPTKQLIAKIEGLSAQLTAQQLREFLDILDTMGNMVEDARALPPKQNKTMAIMPKSLH